MRVQLFDAYMTPEDCEPYKYDLPLLHFRRFYGPEQRDILMLWRNRPEIGFSEGHGRTPVGMERVKIGLYCQHYGKSLSVEHWEETCDYYISHFPFETYGKKWTERKGQAIHTKSDFKRPLYAVGRDPVRQRRADVTRRRHANSVAHDLGPTIPSGVSPCSR